MALFDNNKDNKDKGCNISKRIEKDIKKKNFPKSKGRGMTKNSKNISNNQVKKKNSKVLDKGSNDDKYMDLDTKYLKAHNSPLSHFFSKSKII